MKGFVKEMSLSLERKVEGVIYGESGCGDCDEVICAGWVEPGGEWTGWSWRNKEGSWIHKSKLDGYLKQKHRLVICNEEDTDGRARVTADEELVLPVECRLNRDKFV